MSLSGPDFSRFEAAVNETFKDIEFSNPYLSLFPRQLAIEKKMLLTVPEARLAIIKLLQKHGKDNKRFASQKFGNLTLLVNYVSTTLMDECRHPLVGHSHLLSVELLILLNQIPSPEQIAQHSARRSKTYSPL